MLMGRMWPLRQIFALALKICVGVCRGRSEVTHYDWMERCCPNRYMDLQSIRSDRLRSPIAMQAEDDPSDF